jgi:hypothetical protein
MTNRYVDISLSKAARAAGVLYLTIIVMGIFAEFFVRSSLIVAGDATATANNIMVSEGLFRLGIAGDLIMILCDVALALLFYVLLKPVNKSLSLLAAFFRLTQAAVLGVNLLNLLFVLQLLSGADYLAAFSAEQLYALVLQFLDAHGIGYSIGLVFFGIQCAVLGYLICKSDYIPRILGILLILASAGYLTDSFAKFLLSEYQNYETLFALVVFLPAFIAELSLCLWLIIKGAKIPEIKKGL